MSEEWAFQISELKNYARKPASDHFNEYGNMEEMHRLDTKPLKDEIRTPHLKRGWGK